MKDEHVETLIWSLLNNADKDELLKIFPNETGKKLGLLLYAMGFNDAMKEATKAIKELK